MKIESRDVLLIVACTGVLLLFGLIGAQAQTAQSADLERGQAAFQAENFQGALTQFRAIVQTPGGRAPNVVEQAQLGALECLHRLGDFAGFEQELAALQTRNPQSPVIDEATLLYSTFCYERGEYHLAGALGDLFAADGSLIGSERAEAATLVALRAYERAGDSLFFDATYENYVAAWPDSPNRDQADLLRARVALEASQNPAEALDRFAAFLDAHSDSALVPAARLGHADAMAHLCLWGEMDGELQAIGSELASTAPGQAAQALVERGLWQMVLHPDDEGRAQASFRQASTAFADTDAGAEAARWLSAMDHPDSMDNVLLQEELSNRCWDVTRDRISSFQRFSRQVSVSRGEAFQGFLEDSAVSEEAKAEQMQALSHGLYQVGRIDEAWSLAEEIVDRYPGTHCGRVSAPFTIAMALGKRGQYWLARDRFEAIAQGLRLGDPEAGRVFEMISDLSRTVGDDSRAVAALVDLTERFPDDPLTPSVRDGLELWFEDTPSLRAIADARREELRGEPVEGPRAQLTPDSLRASLLAAVTTETPGAGVAASLQPDLPAISAEVPRERVLLVPGGEEVLR